MEPGSSLPLLQELGLFGALEMYSELEEQEANNIKIFISVPEEGMGKSYKNTKYTLPETV